MDNEELEPQVLTYREFQRQRTLLAWHERRRAHDAGGAEAAHEHAPVGWIRQTVSRIGAEAIGR